MSPTFVLDEVQLGWPAGTLSPALRTYLGVDQLGLDDHTPVTIDTTLTLHQGQGQIRGVACAVEAWALAQASDHLVAICARPSTGTPGLGDWFPALPDGSALQYDDGTLIPGTAGTGLLLSPVALSDPLWLLLVSTTSGSALDAQVSVLQTALTNTSAGAGSQWASWSKDLGVTFASAAAEGAPALRLWGHPPGSLGLPVLAALLGSDDLSGDLVTASVDATATYPSLALDLGLSDVQLFGVHALDQAAIGFSAPLFYSPVTGTVSLSGTIALDSELGITIEVDVPVGQAGGFTAKATYAQGSSALIDPTSLGLPAANATPLDTAELELLFADGGVGLERITALVALDSWTLIDSPRFSLDSLSAALTMFDPLGNPTVAASVDVTATFGPVTMTGDAQVPAGNIGLRLDSTSTPPGLSEVLSAFSVPSGVIDALPQIILTDVDLSYDLSSHSAEAEFSAEASLTIDQVEIALAISIALSHTAQGWTHSFTGALAPGHPLDIGTLIADTANLLDIPVPDALSSLTLSDLELDLDSASGALRFAATAELTLLSETVQMTVVIDRSKGATKPFTGILVIGPASFEVDFEQDPGQSILHAVWPAPGQSPSPIALDAIAEDLGVDLSDVPSELIPQIASATLAYDLDAKNLTLACTTVDGSSATFVSAGDDADNHVQALVARVVLGIGLSDLPVVGAELSDPSADVRAQDLDVIWLSATPSAAAAKALNAALSAVSAPELPDEPTAGFALRLVMELGGVADPLVLSASGGVSAATADLVKATPTAPSGAWLTVQRSFGPLTIQQVGAAYSDGRIQLLLDAGFLIAGFELDLIGLGAGFKPTLPPDIRPTLSGIAVSLDDGPVQIGGGLQVVPGADPAEYDGQLSVTAENLVLSALASYTTVAGQASLFGFAVLDTPLGGPPAFYITAVAAGFAVNRELVVPAIEAVPSFPLVAAVNGGTPFGSNPDLSSALEGMRTFVPVAYGESWLAAGVRATSFELVQSAVLLVVKFGNELEVDVLGVAGVSVPSGDPDPIGFAQLAIEASFRPADGVLAIGAQLTSASYLLSHDCHLTGGFALRSWFRDAQDVKAGDGVVTFGGYHPAFRPPAAYPSVPRIGVNWQVSDDLVVKGSAYFALTPGAVMAGGALDATWSSGGIDAWFSAYADFLLGWRPFYYSADVGVSLGASYTVDLLLTSFTVSVSLGVSISFHGPPFAGEATVDLYVCSITISFGDSDATPDPIAWSDFKSSFLPAPMSKPSTSALTGATQTSSPIETDSICGASVTGGLVKQLDSGQGCDWVINPELLELTSFSVVPGNHASVTLDGVSQPQDGDWEQVKIGVGPVGVPDGALESSHLVTLTRKDAETGGLTFDCEPVTTNVPAATWSVAAAISPSLDGLNTRPRTLQGSLTGLRLRPTVPTPDQTLPISLTPLQYSSDPLTLTTPGPAATPATSDSFDQSTAIAEIQHTLTDQQVSQRRASILTTLVHAGLDVPTGVDLSAFAAAAPAVLTGTPVLSLLGEQLIPSGAAS